MTFLLVFVPLVMVQRFVSPLGRSSTLVRFRLSDSDQTLPLACNSASDSPSIDRGHHSSPFDGFSSSLGAMASVHPPPTASVLFTAQQQDRLKAIFAPPPDARTILNPSDPTPKAPVRTNAGLIRPRRYRLSVVSERPQKEGTEQ